MMEHDDLGALVKAAGFGEDSAGTVGGMPVLPADFERRVMIEVARRAIARSKRRTQRGLIASLSGLAMLFAGCIVALVVWFPAILSGFTRPAWLEKLRIPKLDLGILEGATTGTGESTLPFLEQWGVLILIVLLIGGAVGFIWYLNNLFSNDYKLD